MNLTTRLLGVGVGLIFLANPLFSALAQEKATIQLDEGFNPQAILNDRDLFDVSGMSFSQLQGFLSTHGTLGTYRTTDIDGREKPAAQIIWRVANSYKINPKYLLALMQKEQSLVDDPSPTQKQFDWAAGYGVCDSCSMNDPAIQDFKGFSSQLEWAAKQHREKYLMQLLIRGTTISGYAPGKTTTIDGMTITPLNQATAMLYSYTPHLHGNLNLWRIWRRWFSLNFPDGTIVKGISSKKVYVLRFGTKRPFKNAAVSSSMVDPTKIVLAEDSELASYPDGPTINFPNYALVKVPKNKIYLIVGETKRFIVDQKTFDKLGFNEDEIISADAEDIAGYADGPDITSKSAYPLGLLAKDAGGKYWYVQDTERHAIPHKTFLTLYFKGRPARLLTQKKLETFKIGDPYRLQDGELVRGVKDAGVYVIENGSRRLIPNAATFEELGWKWNNVIKLPDKMLTDYPIGDLVNAHRAPVILASDTQADTPAAPTSTLAISTP